MLFNLKRLGIATLLLVSTPLIGNFTQSYLFVKLSDKDAETSGWLQDALPQLSISPVMSQEKGKQNSLSLHTEENTNKNLLGEDVSFSPGTGQSLFQKENQAIWNTIKFTPASEE